MISFPFLLRSEHFMSKGPLVSRFQATIRLSFRIVLSFAYDVFSSLQHKRFCFSGSSEAVYSIKVNQVWLLALIPPEATVLQHS